MLLAFDDTDSRDGGCTTHLAFRVLLELPELVLSGLPRLVRLNPNVPWKTRGNGAVVLPLGKARGPQVRVGELRGREVLAFPEAAPVSQTDALLDRVWKVLAESAEAGSEPGLAFADDALPATAYWQAVRTKVEAAEAGLLLAASGAHHRAAGSRRALAGCMGALAWPGPPASYEVLAYREPKAWGTERRIDPVSLRGLDATGATFHTWDGGEDRIVCVPHGPDPVLIGLRGRDPDGLRDAAIPALALAARERIDGWLLWATNQASGDHVTPVACPLEAPHWGTIEVAARIVSPPTNQRGGHVHVELEDAHGHAFAAVAFEPAKGLRDTVRGLAPGDRVVVTGAFEDAAVKLEKVEVVSLAPQPVRDNPPCPKCGRKMRSRGPSTGFRCPDCGEKARPEAALTVEVPRTIRPGRYEVPVAARRHLHRPVAWGTPDDERGRPDR